MANTFSFFQKLKHPSCIVCLAIHLFAAMAIGASAQTKQSKPINEFAQVDKRAAQIPEASTKTVQDLANYIRANFSNESDRTRAIFIWIASHIQYDVQNMFTVNANQTSNEMLENVLKTRKGVCMHYAQLFSAIANQVGIQTYTIQGYTKQKTVEERLSHEWCASFIDSNWYLFDPTWGAGYVLNSKFVPKITNTYYRVKPENFLATHMPFDPLWQFVNRPLTNQEFYDGKISLGKTKPLFNFQDSLKQYLQESDIQKLISASRRIEKNGVKNALIYNQLDYNRRTIEYHNNKKLAETYNEAVSLFNDGIRQLNSFVNYRNNQFSPQKEDNEIRKMVEAPEKSLVGSLDKLNEIKNPDPSNANTISQLKRSIDEAMKNLNEQKAFLDKYFKTGKLLRKSLFYKYSVMGVPVN